MAGPRCSFGAEQGAQYFAGRKLPTAANNDGREPAAAGGGLRALLGRHRAHRDLHRDRHDLGPDPQGGVRVRDRHPPHGADGARPPLRHGAERGAVQVHLHGGAGVHRDAEAARGDRRRAGAGLAARALAAHAFFMKRANMLTVSWRSFTLPCVAILLK